MEKRCLKFGVLVLPLLLYTAVMFKMIDNTCPSEHTEETSVFIAKYKHQRSIVNMSSALHVLLKQYEDLELQRQQVLNALHSFMSDEQTVFIHGISNKITNYNGRRTQGIEGFDYDIGSFNGEGKPRYMFNCTNIHRIKLKQKVGHGVSKQAFLGEYRGMRVAVKMVTRHQKEVRSCIEKLDSKLSGNLEARSRCFVFPTMKLMKEILLLEQLNHPGFVPLLGYCVRSEESDSTDLTEHGATSVFEYGERFVLDNLQYLTMESKLRNAIELAKFLWYLENSPLGSLRIRDFKESHFLLINESLKMIDLDDVDNLEPSCEIYSDIKNYETIEKLSKLKTCEFNLPCRMGLCLGFNAKQNMKMMNKLFFKRLLYPQSFPEDVISAIGQLNVRLDASNLSSQELIAELQEIATYMRGKRN